MTMLQDAISELGTTEGKGAKNNPRVLQYHNVTGEWSQDSVPWCGSFMAWLAKKNDIGFSKWKAAAAIYWITDWVTEGHGKLIKTPIPGAIGVKKRTGGNHVFMFHRWLDKKAGVFEAIGGNQSSRDAGGALQDGAVTITRFNLSDVTAWAWPVGVPIPSASKSPLKSGSVLGGSAMLGTGAITAVQVAPQLQQSIETLTQPPRETIAEVVQESGGSLVTAVQKSEEARASGTIFGAVVAVIIIAAAVYIIVSRINNARKERAESGS